MSSTRVCKRCLIEKAYLPNPETEFEFKYHKYAKLDENGKRWHGRYCHECAILNQCELDQKRKAEHEKKIAENKAKRGTL